MPGITKHINISNSITIKKGFRLSDAMLKPLLLFAVLLLILPSGAAFFGDVDEKARDFLEGEELIVVVGCHASAIEKSLLTYVKKNYPFEWEVKPEQEVVPAHIKDKTLVLIGGPAQNTISAQALSDQSFSQETEELTLGTLVFLSGEKGKVLVFSDPAGFNNIARRPERSPLLSFMPGEYVPVAATALSLGLLWLWQLLGNLIAKVFRWKLADKIMKRVKKHQLKEDFKGLRLFGIRLKAREWAAIAISAIVFGISLSYMYLDPKAGWTRILGLTMAVNLVVYGLRHLTRLFLDKHYGYHTEFHIWYIGAFMTAVSGWLGNCLCLDGYTVSDGKKTAEAKVPYIINLVTFIAFGVFWVWNLVFPMPWVQMAMLLTLGIAFTHFLPLAPFSGKSIYAWNKRLWYKTFIPLLVVYIAVNMFV
jgi:hypothetical protein